MDDVFIVADKHQLQPDNHEPSKFDLIIQQFAAAWQQEAYSSGIDRIGLFSFSTGVFYDEYLRQFQALAVIVMVSRSRLIAVIRSSSLL